MNTHTSLAEWIGDRLLQRGDIEITCLRCGGESGYKRCPCCRGTRRVTDEHVADCAYCYIDDYAAIALGEEVLRAHAERVRLLAERKKPVQSEKMPEPPKMAFRLGRE